MSTRQEYEALWGCHTDREYAECVFSRGTTSNGVFAIKVHAEHRPFVRWLVEDDAGLAGLAERVHFCRVRRRDKVRQAVSAYVADRTGRYRQRRSDGVPLPDCVPFDYACIQEKLAEAAEWDRQWSEFFAAAGIRPFEVFYEDDLETAYAETTRRLLDWIGIAVPVDLAVSTDREKQADIRSEALAWRFRLETARGAGPR